MQAPYQSQMLCEVIGVAGCLRCSVYCLRLLHLPGVFMHSLRQKKAQAAYDDIGRARQKL